MLASLTAAEPAGWIAACVSCRDGTRDRDDACVGDNCCVSGLVGGFVTGMHTIVGVVGAVCGTETANAVWRSLFFARYKVKLQLRIATSFT